MLNKTKFLRYMGLTVSILLALVACGPRVGGIVKGAVYGDLNGNGTIDTGEVVMDGVTVALSDCGPAQTQVTAADGLFNFSNLPEGTCHVSVSKVGWIFSGSYPSLTYPVPVASNPDLPTAFSLFMAPVMRSIPTKTPTPVALVPLSTSTIVPLTPTNSPTPVSSVAMVTPKDKDTNCRFGPGIGFSSVGGLKIGVNVPILATISGQTWWQIQNPQDLRGHYCWVSAAVTNTSGDLSLVPVIPIPTGLVTAITVNVSPGSVVHGFCMGPNAVSFRVTITTNGPVTVTYHVEIYNHDGSLRNSPGDMSLVFPNASSQTVDPGGAYKTDCGSYYIKAVVTSPNSISAQANWSVVNP